MKNITLDSPLHDIVGAWTAALRSGKFQQGEGYLTRITDHGDKDCCLGVLCKILIPNDTGRATVHNTSVVTYGGQTSVPPNEIMRKFGERVGDEDDDEWGDDFFDKLIEMNDSGKPFIEIADEIEVQYRDVLHGRD
jgi:hypothetical protein